VKKKIVYEQPLNDRMRNLLRLEYLFAGLVYHLKGPSEWDSRAVVSLLVEILEMIGRADYKTELVKDLTHHYQTLQRWQHIPKVDKERLTLLLEKLKILLEKLAQVAEFPFQSLLQNPMITMVRQRQTIIGGTCRSDLPVYHHWLQKNPKQRQNELIEWTAPLELLREAVELNLYILRNHATVTQETAATGFFQTKLEVNVTYQLIQVGLPLEHPCYPEINGGKQRITIRFLEPHGVGERPLPTEQDVNFELCCCVL